ncbi:MAG TPA: response regulator [Candidatus Nitrosocosmicus sp.]|nr:response regulator [Candidatus Nitrosocosmicus sp.]
MTTTKKKILIADDEEAILEATKEILENEGYDVITATTSISLQRKFWQEKPDLLLLDILMSGTDGREIVYYLKSESKKDVPPIIMMSALPYAEKTAKEAGAIAFLPKPFEMDELVKLVHTYIE